MYIKGFLNTLDVDSLQLDLGIEVILRLFTKERLTEIFELVEQSDLEVSENAESSRHGEVVEKCNNIFKENFSRRKFEQSASTRDLLLIAVEKCSSRMCHDQTDFLRKL